MKYDEPLIGALAIALSLICMAVAIGHWQGPYRLRTVASFCDRFGKPAARGLWLILALAAFSSGLAILSGLRPGYTDKQVIQ